MQLQTNNLLLKVEGDSLSGWKNSRSLKWEKTIWELFQSKLASPGSVCDLRAPEEAWYLATSSLEDLLGSNPLWELLAELANLIVLVLKLS